MIKHKLLKKSVSLLMAVSMVLLAACGQSQPAQETEKSETEQVTEATSESTGRSKISIGVKQSPTIVDYETNYFTNYIEDLADVELEFVILPQDAAEYAQKLSLMVSGGSELPDVILTGPDDVLTYGEAGIFIPIEDYLNDPEKMPNFNKYVSEEKRDFAYAAVTQLDGHIYCGPAYCPEYSNEVNRKAFINKTWLDTLNLEMPTTPDELYDVLKAFKEGDPNGNGEADEIPMIGYNDGHGLPMGYLLNAYIYTDPINYYLYVKDGKITPAFTDDKFLEGLTYMNKLVADGLLSPLSFTQDHSQFKALVNNESDQLIGCFTRQSMTCYNNDSENLKDMYLLPPLTGEDGTCFATYNPQGASGVYFITKDCEDVDAAIRLLDACYIPETGMINRYGEIGVNWSPEVTDTMVTSTGVEPGWMMIENIWGSTQNTNWEGATPRFVEPDSRYNIYAQGVEPENLSHQQKYMDPYMEEYYGDKHPEEIILGWKYSREEMAEAADLTTAITTYVNECIVQFIVGDLPLSEWDNYLKNLEDMGLERWLELQQSAYERYNAQ